MLVGLTHKGAFLVILDLLGRQTYKEVFDDSDLLGKFFPFVTHDGVGLTFRTYREVLNDLNSLGENSSLGDSLRSWLMVLTYEGVSFVTSNPLGSVLGILTC